MKRSSQNPQRKGTKPKGAGQKAIEKFDQKKDVRAIARERVGTVKPSRAILPPTVRKKAQT